MLLLFVGTALVVGLFAGFVIGVMITKSYYEKQGTTQLNEQQDSTEQGTES